MKFFILSTSILYVLTEACDCRLMVETREQCQAICDITTYCEVWTFNENNKFCYMKKRTGWEVIPRLNYYSGFKNQGPFFEADTDYIGGDYNCDY